MATVKTWVVATVPRQRKQVPLELLETAKLFRDAFAAKIVVTVPLPATWVLAAVEETTTLVLTVPPAKFVIEAMVPVEIAIVPAATFVTEAIVPVATFVMEAIVPVETAMVPAATLLIVVIVPLSGTT